VLLNHFHVLLSYKQQLTSRVQETDSVVLDLREQVSILNDQLSEKTAALNDELARAEQQVPSSIQISHSSTLNYSKTFLKCALHFTTLL